MDQQKKKRRHSSAAAPKETFQPSWKRARELPAFLDASASVSAATFGARRLPEIKALWSSTTAAVRSNNNTSSVNIPTEEGLKSSGGKTSSRHLRRRITSHNGRKRHRFPAGGAATATNANDNDNNPLIRKCIRKHKQRLCAPHETWKNTDGILLIKDTTEKQQQQQQQQQGNNTQASSSKSPTSNNNKNNAIHWMTTHLWHAKRFHMADLWGWQIPMVHANRGPKAALRLIREGKSLIQDVTWRMAHCIQISSLSSSADSSSSITSMIRRLCPEFHMTTTTTTSSDKNIGCSTGQGMIYALDAFPRQAIGPVTWLNCLGRPLMGEPSPNTTSSGGSQDSHYYLYFWVHPSIQSSVWSEFQALHQAIGNNAAENTNIIQDLCVGYRGDATGMTCLQLRGIHATNAIQNVLSSPNSVPHHTTRNEIYKRNNQLFLEKEQLHTQIPHGTIMPVYVNDMMGSSSNNLSSGEEAENNDGGGGAGAWIKGNCILLISRGYCDPTNLPQNAPALGWDILCDAAIARELFMKLVLDSQACPIGIVEEAYIHLECKPPVANVFPRDYVETELGQEYWNLFHATTAATAKSSQDLHVLRLCLEEGEAGGRVPVPLIKERVRSPPSKQQQQRIPKVSTQRLCKIPWSDIVTDDNTEEKQDDNNEVVVMRGLFGQPLVDALAGSGTIPSSRSDYLSKPPRRKRRRTKQPREIVHALSLSSDAVEKHLATCTALLQSLSLPAVVACHIEIVGSGTIRPGAEIRCCETEDKTRILGYTTAGSFSVSRGCSHGIGIVGAAKLLRAIVWAASNGTHCQQALAVVGSVKESNERQIRLQVELKVGKSCHKATLALLL